MSVQDEITRYRGRLAEKEEQRRQLKIRIDNRRDQMRDMLDPFVNPEDLAGDRIAALGVELAESLIKYNEILAEIAAIKKALGV